MNEDLMTDSRFANHLFRIESVFAATDIHAAREGMVLSDSAIRSLLVKAINEAGGKGAKAPAGKLSAKESLLAEALASLIGVRPLLKNVVEKDGKLVETDEPISREIWVGLLETLKLSVETRGDGLPGGRGYLEFLKEFVEQARGAMGAEG